eukprot:5120317-Amphidinium_carterae.2
MKHTFGAMRCLRGITSLRVAKESEAKKELPKIVSDSPLLRMSNVQSGIMRAHFGSGNNVLRGWCSMENGQVPLHQRKEAFNCIC